MNVASRLESANKIYGTRILIGEATARSARDAIVTREVDSIAVYGREEGLSVHELVALGAEVAAKDRERTWIVRYEQGLAKYRARQFAGAISDFESVLRERPDDRPADVMLRRCQQLARVGPEAWWRPIAALTSK